MRVGALKEPHGLTPDDSTVFTAMIPVTARLGTYSLMVLQPNSCRPALQAAPDPPS